MSATVSEPRKPVWQRQGQFTALDGRGRPVVVHIYATAIGPPTLLTADGDLVFDLGGGTYEVADTGEILQTPGP
jgi:hypothetical protein